MADGVRATRRGIRRRVKFAKKMSDIVLLYEGTGWTRYRKVPVDRPNHCLGEHREPHSENNPDENLLALAEARDRALRLAAEVDEFEANAARSIGGKGRGNDDRRETVVWTEAGGLIYDAPARIAIEERGYIGMYSLDDFRPVEKVCPNLFDEWDKFLHVGRVPDGPTMPARQLEARSQPVPKTFVEVLAEVGIADSVSYTHLTLPTIYSV